MQRQATVAAAPQRAIRLAKPGTQSVGCGCLGAGEAAEGVWSQSEDEPELGCRRDDRVRTGPHQFSIIGVSPLHTDAHEVMGLRAEDVLFAVTDHHRRGSGCRINQLQAVGDHRFFALTLQVQFRTTDGIEAVQQARLGEHPGGGLNGFGCGKNQFLVTCSNVTQKLIHTREYLEFVFPTPEVHGSVLHDKAINVLIALTVHVLEGIVQWWSQNRSDLLVGQVSKVNLRQRVAQAAIDTGIGVNDGSIKVTQDDLGVVWLHASALVVSTGSSDGGATGSDSVVRLRVRTNHKSQALKTVSAMHMY